MDDTTSTPPAVPAIYGAVWAVMRDVRGIGKLGHLAEGGQQYKFRRYDDMANALGEAFREHGIFVQTTTLKSEYATREVPRQNGSGTTVWTSCRIAKRYRFTSLADGSTLEAEGFGEGRDMGDKATSKAETMAIKYALSQAFMLAVDVDDPDDDVQAEPPGNMVEINVTKNEIVSLGRELGRNLGALKADYAERYDGKDMSRASLDELRAYRDVLVELVRQAQQPSDDDTARAVAAIEAEAARAAR